jgi:phenylacetyl-CoA:acceptor oxidoreductase subunit 1
LKKQSVRWGMAIDLRRCTGCGTCVVACAEANKITSNHWRKVFDCGVSQDARRQRLYLPMNCMHCENPPCLQVCPTTATYQRADGIVGIDHDKCIGCGYCIVACPYYARAILFLNEYNLEAQIMSSAAGPSVSFPDYIGVSSKCTFCKDRIVKGLQKNLIPGKDSEASPACFVHCTSNAIYFGDLNDPESQIVQLLLENWSFCLQEEMGTSPKIYYIIEKNRLKGCNL